MKNRLRKIASKYENYIGKKFNRLIVVEFIFNEEKRLFNVKCLCDCGKERIVPGLHYLTTDKAKSCGCTAKENQRNSVTTHNKCYTSTYNTWHSMLERCYNKKNKHYYNYGGRGIKVCKEWSIFQNFYRDMGEKPSNLTIERIDNNNDYSKINCKWSSRKEQQNNRRNNKILTFNNKSQTLAQWVDEVKIKRSTLLSRLENGWSVEKTLSTPLIK